MNIQKAIIIIALVVLVAAAILVSRYRFFKETQNVLKIFGKADAFDEANAVKADDIGLGPKSVFMRGGMRDYKAIAFQNLVSAHVIQLIQTEEGVKYFLPRDQYDKYLKKK